MAGRCHFRANGNLKDIAKSPLNEAALPRMLKPVSLFFDLVGDAVIVLDIHEEEYITG
jgi:hypothetical protein